MALPLDARIALVSDVKTDGVADRYGTPSPARRHAIIIASGVVGVLALAWLAWAAWFQSTPDVQSSLRSFDVVDNHSASAVVAVKPRSKDVSASCLVRAFGEDHSVVGELNFKVAGVSGTTLREVTLRTEREATSVELVGCTAGDQSRPR
jgi:hypothetical protein